MIPKKIEPKWNEEKEEEKEGAWKCFHLFFTSFSVFSIQTTAEESIADQGNGLTGIAKTPPTKKSNWKWRAHGMSKWNETKTKYDLWILFTSIFSLMKRIGVGAVSVNYGQPKRNSY